MNTDKLIDLASRVIDSRKEIVYISVHEQHAFNKRDDGVVSGGREYWVAYITAKGTFGHHLSYERAVKYLTRLLHTFT